jgi:hypothetical protein
VLACCTTLSKTTRLVSPPAAGRQPWRCWPAGSAPAPQLWSPRSPTPAWEPGRDKHEQYREHVLAALQASPWARVIKASDFTDNAVGIIHTTGPKLPELACKYGPLVPALRVLILRLDTPLEDDVKGTIAAQLGAAQARLAAIRHDHHGAVPLLPGPAPGAKPGTLGGETA